MAAVSCAGVVGTTAAVQWAHSSSARCAVGASRSVAFRGAAVAVKPLRICRRRQDDGVELLPSRMPVRASAEDADGGEDGLTLSKPQGSGKKVGVPYAGMVLS